MTSLVTAIDRMKTMRNESSATLMSSNHIWASGCQSILHSMAMTAQARFEQGWSDWQSLAKAKTSHEAMEIQSGLTQAALQRSLDETSRLTRASIQLMEQAMAPITAHMARPVQTPAMLGD